MSKEYNIEDNISRKVYTSVTAIYFGIISGLLLGLFNFYSNLSAEVLEYSLYFVLMFNLISLVGQLNYHQTEFSILRDIHYILEEFFKINVLSFAWLFILYVFSTVILTNIQSFAVVFIFFNIVYILWISEEGNKIRYKLKESINLT